MRTQTTRTRTLPLGAKKPAKSAGSLSKTESRSSLSSFPPSTLKEPARSAHAALESTKRVRH